MPTGKALNPLSELVALTDFPLGPYLPSDTASTVFDGLFYTSALSDFDGVNLTLNLELAFEGELALALPGTDAIAIVMGSGGPGWTFVPLRLVIGPDFEFAVVQLPISLRVPPDILKDVASGGPAQITVTADMRINAEGLSLNNVSGASLAPANVCGTSAIVEANDVRPVFGYGNLPDTIDIDPSFTGLAIQSLKVTLPPEVLQLDSGSTLDIVVSNATIGSTGFSGMVTVESADLANPVSGTLLGFPFRFRKFALDIQQNALIEFCIGADVRLKAFEDGSTEKWVGIDLVFSDDGSFSAALSAVQPSEASASAALVEIVFPGVFQMDVTALRVTKNDNVWATYVSGGVELLLQPADTDWPKIYVDEIGLDSTGKILLPDGAGITFASPLVVNWHFVRLSITKFRFGYADDSGTKLQLGLSAEVLLMEGLPAGASVEGLIVEWTPGSGDAPSVRLEGIGISFGIPACFQASLYVAYEESAGVIEFRGKGSLALTALDMGIEIGVVVGRQSAPPPEFVFLYLFADAKLLPTGIPIAQTGISIYGFQGLLAYNMALALDMSLPDDERYYELFVRNPIGITDVNKWERRFGQNALGIGIVIGTADKGFCINVKGLLVVAFPDLTILLQAKANILKLKPDLSTAEEGTLDALLVYASGQNTLTLDIVAHWGIPFLLSVEANARAYFSFTNPLAWYLEIGRDEDGKRATAHVIEWNGRYLFAAGSWFHLDADGVVSGTQIDLELRASKGGFWVEASGHARGEMGLSWAPPQWEGMLGMWGRIGAGYRGVSISISLGGEARARARRPFDVHVRVRACVKVILKFCKTFNFDWQEPDPPQLESPVTIWSATPRHWTPRELPAGSSQGALDTGIVQLEPGGLSVPIIQPHSVLSLDFAKAMVDVTADFNEGVEFDNDGFFTIGRDSGWSAAYQLDSVTIVQDPDDTATPIPLWGTWARETLLPNTTLRLNSSIRFGEDGSLTSGFLEGGVFLDYCDPPKKTRICVDLTGVEPGYGYLDDGSLYHWDHPGGEPVDTSDGVTLAKEDTFEVITPGSDPGDNDDNGGKGSVVVVTHPPDKQVPDYDLKGICKRFCNLLIVAAVLAFLVFLILIVLFLLLDKSSLALLFAILCQFVLLLMLILLWLCKCRNPKYQHDPEALSDPDSSGHPGKEDGSVPPPTHHLVQADDNRSNKDHKQVTPAQPNPAGVILVNARHTGGKVINDPDYDAKPEKGICKWFCSLVLVAAVLAFVVLLILIILSLLLPKFFWSLLFAILCQLVLLVLLMLLWLCKCRKSQGGGAGPNDNHPAKGDEQETTVQPNPGGVIVVNGSDTGGNVIGRICYYTGHGNPPWTTLKTRGGTLTQNESWTVPESMQIYPPHQLFELRAEYTARLKDPNQNITTPLGSGVVVAARFRTDGPPAYDGALTNYIASVYPFDGARPVYTGYDLMVQFLDEYVPYLYTSVGEQLSIRLINGQGLPVQDAAGNTILLPATQNGLITRTTAEEVWEKIYNYNVEKGCIEGPPISNTGPTVLSLPAGSQFKLTPNSQYISQLVSDARPQEALHAWAFTTSRFSTFGSLVQEGRTIQPARAAGADLSATDFDGLTRQAGIATVAYVDNFQVTPILTPDGTAVAALLLESPEPLELNVRLTVEVNNAAATAFPNLDSTRGLLRASAGTWPLGELQVNLRWKRDAGSAVPVLSVAGDTADETETFDVDAGGLP